MKKFLIMSILTVSLLPAYTFGAGNDVTLTTDSIIQVGSYTLNISGTSAVVEGAVVGDTNVLLNIADGSTIKVSSPTQNRLVSDTVSGVTTVCNSNESSVTVVFAGASPVTITP